MSFWKTVYGLLYEALVCSQIPVDPHPIGTEK